MKKTFKRIVASLLVAVMLFGSAPLETLTGLDFGSLFEVEAEAAGNYKYELLWPVDNKLYRSSSSYAWRYGENLNKFHYGIDIDGGGDILSVYDGEVIAAWTCSCNGTCSCNNGFGNGVVIYHSALNITSSYAHMQKNSVTVKKGQKVSVGQVLGKMGTTGQAYGVHLHFELMKGNESQTIEKTGNVSLPNKKRADKKADPNCNRINPMPYVNKDSNPNHKDGFVDINNTYVGNEYEFGEVRYVKSINELSNSYYSKITWKTESNYYTIKKSEGSPLRSQPVNDGTNIIDKLKKGTKLIVLGKYNNWYYVELLDSNGNSKKGYMYKDNITKSDTAVPKAFFFPKYQDKNGKSSTLNNRLHKKGEKYFVTGTLQSHFSEVKELTATTYKYNTSTGAYDIHKCTSTVKPNSKYYSVVRSDSSKNLNYNLVFAGLEEGYYRLMIIAKVGSDDKLVEDAYFQVSSSSSQEGKASQPAKINPASPSSAISGVIKGLTQKTKTEILSAKKVAKTIVNTPAPKNDNNKSSSTATSNGYKIGVYKTTAKDGLNIRSGPGTKYGKVAGALPKSTEIEITECSTNGWGKTVYKGVTGWVSMNYCTYVREIVDIQKPGRPTATLSCPLNVATGALVGATWNSVPHATSYIAFLKDINGNVVKTSSGISGNSILFTTTKAGTYYITVAGVNSKYIGDESLYTNSVGTPVGSGEESEATSSVTAHDPLNVTFVDWDGRTETRVVPYGSTAIAPDPPSREGYTFTGWDKLLENITADTTVRATYKINEYNVKFVDKNGQQLGKIQRIEHGNSATPPAETNNPTGRVFIGWSSEDWKCVKEDLVINAVYKWENDKLPVVVSDVKADLISGGYSVSYKLSCTDAVTNGRAVVALKTSEGKLVTTTESAAFSLPSGTDDRNMEPIYVPQTEKGDPASIAEIYIVKSFVNAIPISKNASCTVDLHLQWSEWSETKPADNTYQELETKTEYRYRDKLFETSTSKNYSGWELYNTTSTKQSGSTTNATYDYTSDAMVRRVTTRNVRTDVYKTQYRYSHYRHSNAYTYETLPIYTESFPNIHYTSWMDSPYPYISQSTSCPDYAKYGVKKGTYCSTSGCGCYNWYNEETRRVVDYSYNTTWYDWTETYYTYHFWKWGSFSNWSTSSVSQVANREIEDRILYRYKNSSTGVTEDTSGEFRTFSGNVGSKYAGEQATVFIYKVNEPSDWTGEFVGQTVIDQDGSYSFTFKLRQEPTIETGDYTISLGIEGCTDTMVVGKIEAPKPEYKVTFYNYDGTIWDEQIVVEGGTASVPVNPEREGYTFVGWDSSLTNIGGDVELTARYIQKEYTVVFVDWTNKVVLTKAFLHGDYLVPPSVSPVEGYDLKGWENVIEGETLVTSNMVVTAEYEKKTYEVNFYDFDGNIIDTQTVEYGDEPEEVTEPEKDNHVFTEWNSDDNDLGNRSGVINFYPKFVFAETVVDPVSNLANGTYTEVQTVELSSETENAVIYYTLDGSDPTEGGTEYTGPITLDSSTELKYYAVAFEMNDSEVMTNYYAINIGNTISDWMLYDEVPQYVTAESDKYDIESAKGYKYKNVVTTSNYTQILGLETEGWINEGFEYSEWSNWTIVEPSFDDIAFETETQEPLPEDENRYKYTRFKYIDSASGNPVYSAEAVEGVEGEWEEILVVNKLSVAGFVSGTQTAYYIYNDEQWYNQSTTTIKVVPDYLMYRYRTKNYTLTKWSDWSTDTPAEGESREMITDTVYRYSIPEMYIVNIIPDYSKFGTETITFIAEANELIEITPANYEYAGHDFIGFFTDSEFKTYWNYETEKVTGDLNLYPKYKAHEFDVIFVDYDGTVLSEEIVEYGSCALEPEVNERNGYVFIGWDTEDYQMVTDNLIVTAQYVDEDEYCTVSLNYGKFNLMTGTSFTLIATLTPDYSETENINWYSDNLSVAVVNDEGMVTAVGEGTAVITAEVESTGEIDECIITVSSNPSESLCLTYSSTLTLDKENALLRGVTNSVWTVSAIKQEFMNEEEDMQIFDISGNALADDALVGTGSVIRFMNGETVLDEVYIVVTGDMNGDGAVNNRDAAMITRYLVDKETADFCQMVAIDVNGDGYVNNRDASMVSRYLVGKETL